MTHFHFCRAVGLALIVEKSKKCLDFTVTYFILHLILSTMYNGFPTTFDWWIVHVLSLLVMVVLGEYVRANSSPVMFPHWGLCERNISEFNQMFSYFFSVLQLCSLKELEMIPLLQF